MDSLNRVRLQQLAVGAKALMSRRVARREVDEGRRFPVSATVENTTNVQCPASPPCVR